LNVETKINNPFGDDVEVSLDAEFNEYSVDYSTETTRGDETKRNESSTNFLTGMGNFQKNVGEILDSFKEKEYLIKALTWNNVTGRNDYTNITVKTQVDFVPWWPVDMPQKCSVTVSIDSINDLTQKVIINRVWVEVWTDWDDDQIDYKKKFVIWEKKLNQELFKAGDSKTFKTELSMDKDYGKFGLVGRIDITVIDKDGSENRKILTPFTEDSHPSTINLYTITQNDFISVILMVLAFPFTLVSIILILIALPFVFKSHRIGTILILISAILGLLAIIFYINGLNTIINLLDSSLKTDIREGYSLNMAIISIIISSIILLFIAFAFSFLNHFPKSRAVPGANGQAPPGAQLQSRKSKWFRKRSEEEVKKPDLVFKTIDDNSTSEQAGFEEGEYVPESTAEEQQRPVKRRKKKKKGKIRKNSN
jgi:hypothetical protein